MKHLFTVAGEPFDNKMKAKEYREESHTPGTIIEKGPDHMGTHGHSVVNKKHRRNKKFS